MFKRLIKSQPVQTAIAWLAASYLRLIDRTTSWQIVGAANLATFSEGAPCILAFWHETLPSMPLFWVHTNSKIGVSALVSLHRDGQLIGTIAKFFQIDVAHGSSTRGGAAGLRSLLKTLQDGRHVGLTPDGPRGPRRQAAPGVAQLAALSGARILPCAVNTAWAVQLNSWDRMRVPLPFGRGKLVFGPLMTVPRHDWQAAIPDIEAALTAAVTAAVFSKAP